MYRRRQSGTTGPTGRIAALMAVACLVQAWMIAHAVVPAQDSIRYLTVAQAMARDGLLAAVQAQPEQPLFPSFVCLLHWALRQALCSPPGGWALSLQLAAAAALVLSVAPVYRLFERLHGARAALVGALLYCVVGGIARLGADGLSDSTHLLFLCVALWSASEYFAKYTRRPSAAWLFVSGLGTALALLTRAESIVLPAALLAAYGVCQAAARWRQPRPLVLRAAGAMMLGLLPPLCAYLVVCRTSDVETAAYRLLGQRGAIESLPLNDLSPIRGGDLTEAKWQLPGIGQLVFGKKDVSTSSRFRGLLPAAAKLIEELAQTLHYGLGALALVGLWRSRRQLNAPLDRFMQILCAALLVAALYVAAGSGYLSTRHLLLLVLLALGWAAVGALAVGDALAERCLRIGPQRLQRRSAAGRGDLVTRPWHPGRALATVKAQRARWLQNVVTCTVGVLAVVSCSGDLLRPLHASRMAHRDAADWLNAHAAAGEAVLDSRGWTALYTGRKTYRYEAAQAAFCDPALAYVVVEQAELEAPSRRGETLRLLVDRAGEPAALFSPAGAAKHGVMVWRWHPERFATLGVVSDAR